MARTTPRPRPTAMQTLTPLTRSCPTCGNAMWAAYHNYRTSTTLTDVRHLTRNIRHCITPDCPPVRHPYRPAAEGRRVLPKHACGLDLIARVGTLRHAQPRSVPEIQQEWARRRIAMAPRPVLPRLERSDARGALSVAEPLRLQRVTKTPGRVILALAGLPPDVGHEVLWGLRDCLASAGLLARSLLSATQADLATLLREVTQALGGPIVGIIADGPPSIRCAGATALGAVPHQLCHFHSLRAAAKPVYEAARHAKQERKKRGRGGRPLARQREKRPAPAAEVARGYCNAVRRALTDDGHPPLAAAGLPLHGRLTAISQSLERGAKRGPCPRPAPGGKPSSSEG